MSKEDLLLEIGTEEIPAGFMEPTFEQLEELAQKLFEQYRIDIDTVATYGTPRRLTLLIKGVSGKQADLTEEIKGPAENIAFDEAGNPNKAAKGFAKGQGLTVNELEIKDTDNGRYLFAIKQEKGRETIQLLPEILTKLIKQLDFSKSMRWADKDFKFIRPIHWILAFYGDDLVEFEVAGIESDNYTIGHRFLSTGEIEINSPEEYFDKLNDEYVIVDQKRRREMIVEQITELGHEAKGEVPINKDLLTEVNYLVEYPTALLGSFDQEFLELPREVLITSMREHQRYFPVEDKDGNLMAKFITVRNGSDEHIDIVRKGNEKVLRARLADAKFFYNEDQKEELAAKVEELKGIIFQEDLGTIYEKVERLVDLSEKFAQILDLAEEQLTNSKRAAYLSKADLVTEMVNEFPKLEGIMGREYAKLSGEEIEVAEAIFEHHLPRHASDILPESIIGQIVSLADKIDNIVGSFGVGLIPTGSQDPYALRRQAQGIVKIILENELSLDLNDLINSALELLLDNDKLPRDTKEVEEEVVEFFKQRLERFFEQQNIRYDVRNAILNTDFTDINDAFKRAKALMKFREKEEFETLITAYNRAGNLAAKANEVQVDLELFVDSAEKELYEKTQQISEKIRKRLDLKEKLTEEDYVFVLEKLTELQQPIDEFFDSVMVMADEEAVKENRLALLQNTVDVFNKTADLSQIAVD